MPSSSLFGALGSGFDVGVGLYDLIKGGSMHPHFTPYQIPQEEQDQLALAQAQLNSEMPGTSLYEQNILQNQGNMLGALGRGSRGSSSYLAGLSGLMGGTNKAFQNLQLMQEQSYGNRLATLMQAQNRMAGYRDKAYQINKYEPYLRDLQRKYNLTGAGEQNISGGLQGIGDVLSMSGGGGSIPAGAGDVNQTLGGQVGYQPLSGSLGAPGLASRGSGGGGGGGLMQFLPLLMGL